MDSGSGSGSGNGGSGNGGSGNGGSGNGSGSGSDREMVDSCLHAYQVYCQQGRKQYLVPSWYGLSTCVPNHPSHNPKP
jgi:hypothetical protein